MERKRSCRKVDEKLFAVVKYYQDKGESTRKVSQLTGLALSTIQTIYREGSYDDRNKRLEDNLKKYKQKQQVSEEPEKVGLGESTIQELYKTKNYEERLAYLREKAKERREKKEQAEQTVTPQPLLDVKEDSEIKGLLEQILDELKKLNEVWG